ncbi:MAG: S41 family peptidase [Minisyncoccia bacterium]
MNSEENPQQKRTRLRAISSSVAFAVVFCAGVYIGIHVALSRAQSTTPQDTITLPRAADGQPENVDMSEFWNVWNMLQQNFVQAHATGTIPSTQDKINGAIEGLVSSYGDPYTTFFTPSQATAFNQDIQGSFGGVGIEIGSDSSGNLIVIAPLKGSPAAKAGIQPGDKIIDIDATSSATMDPDEATGLIRGPVGSTIKLTILHASSTEPIVVPIVRQTINIPIINYQDDGNGVYEIDLYEFSADSADDFRTALRAFEESGDHKLLLDLRGNPGGYLEAAVDMASYFLPAGQTVVTEDFEGHQQNVVNKSYGYNVFAGKNLKMAILIDQGTASAAEILSGALQQQGVAKLVGTRSFGKGSVQEVMDLGGGSELKVTVAKWLTPNGHSIEDGGLTPDINATTTQSDLAAGKDPQKQAALQYLESQ